MRKDDEKEHGQNAETEDEQVKRSNELLALIRERMAKSGSGREGPKKLQIPTPE